MITHFLSVQFHLHVCQTGMDFVSFRTPISLNDMLAAGGHHLLVAGITHGEVSRNAMVFATQEDSISLAPLLTHFWSEPSSRFGDLPHPAYRNAFGKPDLLVIDHKTFPHLRQEFFDWLKDQGVSYEHAESNNRKAISRTRPLNDVKRFMMPYIRAIETTEKKPPAIEAINTESLRYGEEKYFEHMSKVKSLREVIGISDHKPVFSEFSSKPTTHDGCHFTGQRSDTLRNHLI